MPTNSTVEEWLALIARARRLREAAIPFLTAPRSGEFPGTGAGEYLMKQVYAILGRMWSLRDLHPEAISPAALAHVWTGNHIQWGSGSHPAQCLQTFTLLAAFVDELEYLLRDNDTVWASLTERALLHLNRTLVVDHDVQRRWSEAFSDGGETPCERLGGVHLLKHGIWGFKAHTPEERTDLVLQEPIPDITTRDKRAVEAMVLTEWKLVRDRQTAAEKFAEARSQLAVYGHSILAGFELASVRYGITVGMQHAADEADVIDERRGITYRHIHIAIQRQPPSELSRLKR